MTRYEALTIEFKERGRLTQYTAVKNNEDENLQYVDVWLQSQSFMPANLNFFPFQVNVFDLSLDYASTSFLGAQQLVSPVLCVHPLYTGFHAIEYGDYSHGISKKDYLHMVPHLHIEGLAPYSWLSRVMEQASNIIWAKSQCHSGTS